MAQVKGRNAITWEEKIDWDLKYIERVTFWGDLKLVIETVKTAFIKGEGITDGETTVIPVSTTEYGLSKATRPENSRLDKSKLVEAGFKSLPDWKDAIRRYLAEANL